MFGVSDLNNLAGGNMTPTVEARISGRSPVKALGGACLITLVSIIANAQPTPSGGTPTGPINIITPAQYEQMVQTGVQFFPITPEAILRQELQTAATYLKNREIVENFIAEHPNLSGLTQLYEPATNPAAVPTFDGNYLIQNPEADGSSQTVETMGPATEIAQVATSILVSSDPVQ